MLFFSISHFMLLFELLVINPEASKVIAVLGLLFWLKLRPLAIERINFFHVKTYNWSWN